MDDRSIDRLLEDNLSGDPPGGAFRTKAMLTSTAALASRRRIARRWRAAALSAAAVLIAAVSFLLGRSSVEQAPLQPLPGPVAGVGAEGVAVSNELVAWLEAAQLFRQLKMEDRMARAVDRAANLLPAGVAPPDAAAGPALAFAGGVESQGRGSADPPDRAPSPTSFGSVNRMMAQFLGD